MSGRYRYGYSGQAFRHVAVLSGHLNFGVSYDYECRRRATLLNELPRFWTAWSCFFHLWMTLIFPRLEYVSLIDGI